MERKKVENRNAARASRRRKFTNNTLRTDPQFVGNRNTKSTAVQWDHERQLREIIATVVPTVTLEQWLKENTIGLATKASRH